MDNTKRFSGRAEDYTLARPSYSEDFITMLCDDYGVNQSSVVADIGSGTGKLSKQILEKDCTVFCVEPNDDMRQIAELELGSYKNFKSVNGNSSDTKLDDESVDFITVAQAFHWFDAEAFKKECKRILRPDGKVLLIWNTRDMTSEFNIKSYEIYKKYCPDFKGYHGGMRDDDNRITDFFDNNCRKITFENPLSFTKEKFIARSLSASYSIKNDNKNYKNYIEELEKLFDKYSENGVVIMKNNTVAYIGEVK